MKEKIAVLTDSSSSIYNVNHNFENLFLIDLPVFLDGEVYTNFLTFNDHDFYMKLSTTTSIPKTSQPSLGETLAKYEMIKNLGYTHLIYLPISKELSGTYQNAILAKEMMEGLTIEVIDTKTTAAVLGRMALSACSLIRQGYDFASVVKQVNQLIGKAYLYLVVDDLTYLVKNGRLSNAKSFVANLLKIKPVIRLTEEGKLVASENIRTFKKAFQVALDKLAENVVDEKGVFQLYYTNNTQDLRYAEKLILDRYPKAKIEIHTIPATIVAHVGLAAIALGYLHPEGLLV